MFKRSLFSLLLLSAIVCPVVYANDAVDTGKGLFETGCDKASVFFTDSKNWLGDKWNSIRNTRVASPAVDKGYFTTGCDKVTALFADSKNWCGDKCSNAKKTCVSQLNAFRNAQATSFALDMVNPKAYAAACKGVWDAGFKKAAPTLWADHRPVVIGTGILVTATAAAVAYYKGLFSKAKNWVDNKIN
ncbi:MAG: hypothetical protein WD055_01110 [Candidatus Dependentiae bacterium]